MFGYIYRTHFKSGKYKYVGMKMSDRFLGREYLGSGTSERFQKLKKECKNSAYVELIETCSFDDSMSQKEKLRVLGNREQYWIKFFRETDKDSIYLNIAAGGNAFSWNFLEGEARKNASKNLSISKMGKKNPNYIPLTVSQIEEAVDNTNLLTEAAEYFDDTLGIEISASRLRVKIKEITGKTYTEFRERNYSVISKEEFNKVVREEENIDGIAQHFSLSASQIARMCKRLNNGKNITTMRLELKGFEPLTRQSLLRGMKQGKSLVSIASHFGVSESTIKRFIEKEFGKTFTQIRKSL